MTPEAGPSTVYFDGSCPLCRAEIGHYRRQEGAAALCFVDVSRPAAALPSGLTQEQALRRFHVRTGDGLLLSGAAAFVAVWSRLPKWRGLARAARLPGALWLLEAGYRLFLPLRPVVSRLLARISRPGAADPR